MVRTTPWGADESLYQDGGSGRQLSCGVMFCDTSLDADGVDGRDAGLEGQAQVT
jgi:hypothetical protein